ncbi:alginate export family protein [Maricaulis parjimensis]|uniref:alginate export family protein n=1 Tax=Maricaulis parjimensis TaxID=144023 RepID=UPI00193A7620|nr:alginate export family protein [Maricaulis parjimensis]
MKPQHLLLASAGLMMAFPAATLADGENGTVFLDMRARYENADQDGKLGADATTLRTRLGWRSPDWNGFTFLGEVENVVALDGDDDYNSGLNGLSQYTSISDGAFTELNRLQASYAFNEHVSVTVGRQYLDLDDGRFVASAGHRQDKNSHDALRVDYTRGDWRATYVYHDQINRGPGDDSNWDSDSHLFNVRYAVAPALTVSGFLYLIDITEPGRGERSNQTWGGRMNGGIEHGDYEIDYAVMFSRQQDYGSATTDFDLGLISTDFSVSRGGAEFAVGYDIVEGNGSTGVSNPLGKNHGVLGWADAFSGGGRQGTVDGVEDFNVMASYGLGWESGWLRGLETGVRYHDFSSERLGDDLGEEWDAFITAEFPGGFELSWQFADYDGPDVAPAPADRVKNWIILSYSR